MATPSALIPTWQFPHGPLRFRGNWEKLTVVLLVGYFAVGRAFAYLGLPWINLYIGEIALAAFLLFGPSTQQGPWLRVVRRIRRLRRFGLLLILVLCDGALEALRGTIEGYPLVTALRDTAFNYYPLFLFLGIWIGLRDRTFSCRFAHAVAWFNGVYGLAYVLFLSWLPWTVPGTAHAASTVPLFSEPSGGSAVALLGLVAFEPHPRKVWHLIVLNLFVLLGVQVRAEWLGFALGLLVFAYLTKRIRQLMIASGLLVLLLGLMYATDLNLISPRGRGDRVGTRISAEYLVARAVAPVSKTLAERLAPVADVRFAVATAEWRLVWWASIWQAIDANPVRALLGFGYGYPIGELNPDIQEGRFIQTPHNDFFYSLGYSGWLGVALFVLLHVEIAQLLWRSYRATGQPFGPMIWAALLTMSMFGEYFEAPFGAIPFYLVLGVVIAPAMFARRRASANGEQKPLHGLPGAPIS
jgi:O-Antigen ligase